MRWRTPHRCAVPEARRGRTVSQPSPRCRAGPAHRIVAPSRIRIVDALLQSRRRTARNPGRIAHHDVCTFRGGVPHIRLLHPHPIRDSETVRIVDRAPNRARVDVCRHHFRGSAPGQEDSEHPGPGAEVKDHRAVDARRPGRLGDQVDVLVPNWAKTPYVGGCARQGGHLMPLRCHSNADHPEDPGRRRHRLPALVRRRP